ncbi:4-hydroxybenzoate solanesyltransferase [Synechocystis sp. PCC 7339]|uniref:4-hydroxybenzoate solanesyltransferase n=1 Tax=unclassified Synechocystis TaxID=2640012 RepID=UPI001BAEECC9|nr:MULTISPECIES: 4-hydroxybenzoate solanesyltransferase [unclassified Synechocystis]QUS62195.1 4-hydroxybenzoate solanesyltransferase [Synechocystis sp. PCC 7338]UAJ71379.1 4-hydroxybenzoate solanesyltransferase [Synechocystis sp. PCC 7339]
MVAQTPSSQPLWLTIIYLLRWHKPAGRLILMIPALWAVCLAAQGLPPLPLLGVITLGTLATSGLGCVVNDLWDRDIDPQVERTKQRPLAARTLSVQVGIGVGLVALLCAAGLAFYLTPLSFWLCVAAVPVIVAYPGAKRVFPVPQLVLSIAWGFAVLISWSAVTGDLTTATWVLWGATVFWTLGFDTVYAMADREDDRRIGVNSSALFFGQYVGEAVGIFFALTIGCLFYLGMILMLNPLYWLSLAIAIVGWVIQYIQLSAPTPEPKLYGQIFGQNVTIGFVLLAGMLLGWL